LPFLPAMSATYLSLHRPGGIAQASAGDPEYAGVRTGLKSWAALRARDPSGTAMLTTTSDGAIPRSCGRARRCRAYAAFATDPTWP